VTRRAAQKSPSNRNATRANQTEPAALGLLSEALRGFELVSIDGELAMVLRLGRRSDEPLPDLTRVPRRYTLRDAPGEPETIAQFLATMTRRAAGARTRAGILQDSYRAWCYGKGLRPASRNALRRAIEARGFNDRHSNGVYWLDLAMVDAVQSGALL